MSAAPVEPYAPKAPESATLKDTFKGAFLIGAALNPRQFGDTDPATTAFITRQFNCATPENDLKWERTEPQENEYTFKLGDEFIAFCQRHHLVAIGHNLCWHAQLPSWVSQPAAGQDQLTKEVLLARLKNHIMTVAGHFKGQVLGWDVVNEAIADRTGEYRNDVFYRVIGKEYLALAFKWAHEADPNAQLYYNEYNLAVDPAKRARAVELVKYLRAQGAHIDGIGLQGHYNLTAPTPAEIDETIQTFADLGLKVMITELDVEAIRGRRVSGAVDATNGAQPQRPRFQFFPTTDELKSKLKLTDAQAAEITPLFDGASKKIQAAVAAGDFGQIREIRADTLAAAAKHLDDSQRATFTEMTRVPPWARRGPPPKPLTPEQQRELAQRYGEIFDVLVKHRAQITRVTFWGLQDSESWRREYSPLLFSDHFQRKPAYDAVIAAAKNAGL